MPNQNGLKSQNERQRKIARAITLMVYGHHFRKTCKGLGL